MIIDHITSLGIDLGVPVYGLHCETGHTKACKILDVVETLLLIDHDSREPRPYLGERFRTAKEKANV